MSKSLGNVVAPQSVTDTLGADILRLWVMTADTSEDLRVGPEILKQQGELYRRLRNTLRWVLGGLEGFSADEAVAYAALPELERWVLHRLSELGARVAGAVESHDWIGVYPELHAFCAADLSAFYFDVRKDALYCDAPGSPTRRAVRTVLDVLHRCLATWLAPVLCFTAEEAWQARFGDGDSVHEQRLFEASADWQDDVLASRWQAIRELRGVVTRSVEVQRNYKVITSSLQAAVTIKPKGHGGTNAFGDLLLDGWKDILIVSSFQVDLDGHMKPAFVDVKPDLPFDVGVDRAAGSKCARCWKVLEEVGESHRHPQLCRRCVAVVESGVTYRVAAE